MVGPRIHINPPPVGKNEFAEGASTKDITLTPTLMALQTLIFALASPLGLTNMYINAELQKAIRFALKLFVCSQKRS